MKATADKLKKEQSVEQRKKKAAAKKQRKEDAKFQDSLNADFMQMANHGSSSEEDDDDDDEDQDQWEDYSQFEDVQSKKQSDSSDPATRAAALFQQSQQMRSSSRSGSYGSSLPRANAPSFIPPLTAPTTSEIQDAAYLSSRRSTTQPALLSTTEDDVADFRDGLQATSQEFVPSIPNISFGNDSGEYKQNANNTSSKWEDKELNPSAQDFLSGQATASISAPRPPVPPAFVGGGGGNGGGFNGSNSGSNGGGFDGSNSGSNGGSNATSETRTSSPSYTDPDEDALIDDSEEGILFQNYAPDDNEHHAFVFHCNEENEFDITGYEPYVFGANKLFILKKQFDLVKRGTPLWLYNRVSKFVFGPYVAQDGYAENIVEPGGENCLGLTGTGKVKNPYQVQAYKILNTVESHDLCQNGDIIQSIKKPGWISTEDHDALYAVTRESL